VLNAMRRVLVRLTTRLLSRAAANAAGERLDQTNIAILNYAFVPIDPASRVLFLNLALAVILGSMLGASVSLTREMLVSPHPFT